jgi:hypothetical protein
MCAGFVGRVCRAWRQLNDLELAGRVMISFMRGHMAEVATTMSYVDYFRTFGFEFGPSE